MMAQGRGLRCGVDIGGTFTDVVVVDEASGRLHIFKLLTTPDDPSRAAIDGIAGLLREQGLPSRAVNSVIHGTTLVTNTLIERKGAKAGLITTRGFRDILEIGREKRYDIYDLFLEMPKPPLAPRYLRREVTERVDSDGHVVTPLDEDEVRDAIWALLQNGAEAIAVCFIHAFMNPDHERRVAEILQDVSPKLPYSLSSEVLPEIREYERTSTTVANIYVKPVVARYLDRMQASLRRLHVPGALFLMLSSGGIGTCDTAARFPIRLVESGPAAGALAAALIGELSGIAQVFAFDMGGTTAKTCLIDDGIPAITTDFEVDRVYQYKKGSGLPVRVPVIEMVEIGAGGGSLARIDAMELLKVGPQSAGAVPGPLCYGRGGTEPTVTDADLLLGYLNAAYFLGGKMHLDVEAARRGMERLGARVGMTWQRAAQGISDVVNENMANMARVHTAERGKELSRYTLIAFGGSGPVHAYEVAKKLGLTRMILPLAAGVTSAIGLLWAPPAFDLVRSQVTRLDDLDWARVNAVYAEMEAEAAGLLRGAGVADADTVFERAADFRYIGQGYEVTVPLPRCAMGADALSALIAAFEAEYTRLYQRLTPGAKLEVLNWRLRARGPQPELALAAPASASTPLASAQKGVRPAYFPEMQDFVACPVYDRYRLAVGQRFAGPAIVEERESTAILGPAAHVEVDRYLNLVVTLAR
jgi:N-methylhydantoinase A